MSAQAVSVARPGLSSEWIGRGAAWAGLAFVAVGVPLMLPEFWNTRVSLAVIYAIVALSLNVLVGYAGQISLGHQGFFGVGAFTSAYVVSVQGQTFWVGLLVAAVVGGLTSALMGAVALRVSGLYLALITLAYGRMAEASIFTLPLFGEGAGVEAPRPGGFESAESYYFLCLVALGVVLYINFRFVKSKAGRAVQALRENEQVASSYAINVAGYKLLAFVLSGIMVGAAGSLLAHLDTTASPQTFDFSLALLFVIFTVVGGLRSPVGIVVWTLVFTLLPQWLGDTFGNSAPFISQAVGSLLLVAVLVFKPGGIGQIIRPITNWMSGGKFEGADEEFVAEGVSGRP